MPYRYSGTSLHRLQWGTLPRLGTEETGEVDTSLDNKRVSLKEI